MKKNYYSIHKNKKKRKSTLTQTQKAWKKVSPIILKAMIFVQKAIQASQQKRMPIPKYRMSGNTELGIVNDNILNTEVLEWKGKIHDFPYFDTNKKNNTFEM